jgi:tight adherence protein C
MGISGGTIGMILSFGMVILIAFGLGVFILLNPKRTAGDRLDDLMGKAGNEDNEAIKAALAARLSQLATSTDEDERNLLKIKLLQAGYRDPRATDIYNAGRVALLMAIPLLIAPFLAFQRVEFLLIGVVVSAIMGYMLPQIYVGSRITARQKSLLQPFPDALDLLVTSVEAGLGVDAAFRRVATELEAAAPELALEFQLVNNEISAGVARPDALKHLAVRTGLKEIKALVNMLTQAERFGTSIARAMRIHSDLTRQKRMARAEEAAAKVSPKLTVVMILFLLPCLFIVLLGPAIIKVKNLLMSEGE